MTDPKPVTPVTPVTPPKKSVWKKIGSALTTVAATVVEILMAGKGGED